MSGSTILLDATPASDVFKSPASRGQLKKFESRKIEDKIHDFMKYYAFDDAVFLAEIYHDKINTEHSLYLLTDTLFRANRKDEVFGLLKNTAHLPPRLCYVFAKCCYDLKKYEMCQSVLVDQNKGQIRDDILADQDIAAHAHLLYATLLCDEAHVDEAVNECEKALELDSMMWSLVCKYIKYGGLKFQTLIEPHVKTVHNTFVQIDPATCYTEEEEVSLEKISEARQKEEEEEVKKEAEASGAALGTVEVAVKEDDDEMDAVPPTMRRSARLTPSLKSTTSTRTSTPMTPVTSSSARRSTTSTTSSLRDRMDRYTPQMTSNIGVRATPPAAPVPAHRKSSRLSEVETRRGTTTRASAVSERPRGNLIGSALFGGSDTENVHTATAPQRTRGSNVGGRGTAARAERHSNLRSNPNRSPSLRKREAVKQPLSSRNSNLARSLSGSTNSIASSKTVDETPDIEKLAREEEERKNIEDAKTQSLRDLENQKPKWPVVAMYSKEYKEIFDIVTLLSSIEESVGTYNWKRSDMLFDKLDRAIMQKSAAARLLLAKSCFEQMEYGEARTILHDLHKKKPQRVEGMELLSTTLWHLQDAHSLSALAQTLTTDSRERPQSWCAAGNCFSLQRQHTQAIECMERALQLDPRFAYAHTLLGHELIVQEELDRAAGAFRQAILLSPRDYRSWYGLGQVHLKKEQNSMAQANMHKAVSINPTNRAMLCTLSQVEQQRGRTEKAMEYIDRALALNPMDVACRFNKARLLFETKQNNECLDELNRLKNSSPDEAFVFHLLAKVHRRMGNTHLALLNYSWAAELDPRGDQSMSGPAGTDGREDYEDDFSEASP